MKVAANERVKTKKKTSINTSEVVHAEVSKGAIRALTITGVLVGLWVAACVVGGIVVSGGLFTLVKGWFGAVSGG